MQPIQKEAVTISKLVRRFAFLLAVSLFFYPVQYGQARPPQSKFVKNIILVHGAWADGSSWSKVITLLEADGLNVVAVQLPLTSLSDDVATVNRALALEDRPVLLVGHSYGGEVITEAGNDPKVAGLVFVAAYAPDEGESAESLATANPTPIVSEIRVDSLSFIKLTFTGIADDFAQDLSDAEKKILAATQGPWSATGFAATITAPAWKTKPTWFAVAENDRVISPSLEEMEARRMNATTNRYSDEPRCDARRTSQSRGIH